MAILTAFYTTCPKSRYKYTKLKESSTSNTTAGTCFIIKFIFYYDLQSEKSLHLTAEKILK